MIPFLNIILLTSSPLENFVSLKNYISQNAQKYCPVYFIYEDIVDIIKKDKGEIIEKNREAFFEYLDSIGVGYTFDGYYYYFFKKK